jgi:hypothetical protein
MAAKTPSKPAAKPQSASKPGSVKPLAAAALTLASAKQSMQALVTQGDDEHWQIGALYNAVAQAKLAETGGYKGPRDYFAQEVKEIAPTTLTRYAAVAKAFTEDEAKQYGCSKLGLLLTYEALANTGAVSGDPGAAQVHVPQKDGSLKDLAFQDCSEGDLTLAIHQLKAGASPLPAETVALVQKLQKALETGFGAHPAQLSAKARGRGVLLDLVNVPVDQLRLVLHALLDALG